MVPTIKKIEYSGTQHIQNEYSTTQLIQIPQIRWSFQKVTNFSGNRGRRVDSFQASDWPAVTFPVISLVAAVNSHQSTRSIEFQIIYLRKWHTTLHIEMNVQMLHWLSLILYSNCNNPSGCQHFMPWRIEGNVKWWWQ